MTERIAIYLRLSKEDDFVRDESNSISNQRDLIMRYIRRDRKLRNQEIIECIDDGYSRKNMNRPGMEAPWHPPPQTAGSEGIRLFLPH